MLNTPTTPFAVRRRGFLGLVGAAGVTGVCAGSATRAVPAGSLTVACDDVGASALRPLADAFRQRYGAAIRLVVTPLGASRATSADVHAVAARRRDAVWTATPVLAYRRDLFEDRREQDRFADRFGYTLSTPTTWAHFVDVARHFTRPADGLWGTDAKSAVTGEWLSLALQAGSPAAVLDEEGRVIVDDPGHREALRHLGELVHRHRVALPASTWAAGESLFARGTTAMTRTWPVTGDSRAGFAPLPAGAAGLAALTTSYVLRLPGDRPPSPAAARFVAFAAGRNAPVTAAGAVTLAASATRPAPLTPHWPEITATVLEPLVRRAVAEPGDPGRLLRAARGAIEAIVRR